MSFRLWPLLIKTGENSVLILYLFTVLINVSMLAFLVIFNLLLAFIVNTKEPTSLILTRNSKNDIILL